MQPTRMNLVVERLLLVGLIFGATMVCADEGNGGSVFATPDRTVLRLARSSDGLRFEDTGHVLAYMCKCHNIWSNLFN